MEPITTTKELAAACSRLAKHDVITVDTEFLRETTYFPILCVAQVASADEALVIDALAEGIDLAPFFKLMANEKVLKVFHAARQDIEIVWHRAKMIPHPVFDTQVAAMVLGYGDSISYDQLVQRITGDTLDKSNRFTDWTRRPLTPAQARDVPRGRVLKDEVVGDLAVQGPTTMEKLASLRSLPKGFERSKWGHDILEAVKRGLARDPKSLPMLERGKQAMNGTATLELLKVLLRMTAERNGVAAKVIATVDDLEQIAASDDADVPALKGWRREMFGEKAIALKHGRLALAVEKHRVVAVER